MQQEEVDRDTLGVFSQPRWQPARAFQNLTPVLNNSVGVLTELKDNFREPTDYRGRKEPMQRTLL